MAEPKSVEASVTIQFGVTFDLSQTWPAEAKLDQLMKQAHDDATRRVESLIKAAREAGIRLEVKNKGRVMCTIAEVER